MLTKVPHFKAIDLNGFLPINKPAGLCCNKILFAIRADLNYMMRHSGMPIFNANVEYARHLEPFAQGLMTFIFGWSNQRRRNFIHADYKYRAILELGVEREYQCIDGNIKGTASIGHIDQHLIQSTLEQFVGKNHQKRLKFFEKQKPDSELCENMASIDLYNLYGLELREKPAKAKQKYPLAEQLKEVDCRSIDMIDYCEPYLYVDITCQGGFSMRCFCQDLAEKLETKASLVKLIRLMEGPMWLDDLRVLQVHEANLDYYYNRIAALQHPYKKYISQFDDLFENRYYRHI